MTTHTIHLLRRIAPVLAAAAVLWSAAPAVGFELVSRLTPHEASSLLLFGGGLFGCAAAVRRKPTER